MRNARAIFWLCVITTAAIAANLMLSWRVPTVRGLPRRTLLDPTFQASALTISRSGSPATVLERTDRWRLVQPYSGAVDSQVVLRLLDALAVTPVTDSMTDSELLKLGRAREDFGLVNPAFRLSVSDGVDGVSFSFGSQTPASNGVYVAVEGSDSVFVVPDSVRRSADLRADAFRERDIFPYEPEFVLDFNLRKAGETPLSFVRGEEGWKVGDSVASFARVRDFLTRLTEVNAVEFVWPVGTTNEESSVSEARLVGYGLDAGAAIVLTLHCRDGVDRRILLGNDVGEGRSYALVHNGTAIVVVDSALKSLALAGTRSFVDARLFPFDAASVSAYTLSEGDASYVVARGEEGSWRLDAPVVAPADPHFALEILGRILALTPSDLVETGIKVSVSTNRAPCVVSAQTLIGKARLEDLRSSEILHVDPALVRRLVSTPGGKDVRPAESIVYSRERKTWNVESVEGSDRAVDADSVKRLLVALNPLNAQRIVTLSATASELAQYGLDRPIHTLSVDQEKDGAVRRNIFIGGETKGGRFATVGSAEAIFVLPKKTVEAIVAPLLED